MDETGFGLIRRQDAMAAYRQSVILVYRVSPKRGSLLAHVTSIVMHDHWKPYYTLKGVSHALYNAHHLRELKALVEIEMRTGRTRCGACCAAPATRRTGRASRACR